MRFGAGSRHRVGEEIAAIGGNRALILSTPFQKEDANRLSAQLGPLAAGVFAEARMHTPVDVTARALAAYATSGAYGPELTLGLPVAMSVASGLNAIAHAVEGLYASDANPVTSLMAVEGIAAFQRALPAICRDPADLAARSDALSGSWLCGTVVGAAAMALHHKLCHTLGGAFDVPDAQTHAILLPHTMAFNTPAAQSALRPAADLFGGDLGGGLYDLALSLGAPMALKYLGGTEADLVHAADLAVKNPYANPREVTRAGVLALLQQAWAGTRPAPI